MTLFPGIEAEQRAAEARASAQIQRYREHEADFTPRPIVRPLVARVMPMVVERWRQAVARGEADPNALHVCGLCSGPGVWESEVLRWCYEHGIPVKITATEIREEEREHLRRHAHEVIIDDWHVAIGMRWDGRQWVWGETLPRYDLIISNPAFTQARAPFQPGWPPPRYDDSGKKLKATPEETAIRKRLRAEAQATRRPEIRDWLLSRGVDADDDLVKFIVDGFAEYDPEQSMPILALRVADVVALYGTQQCWTKTASGWLVRLARGYNFVTDVPGAVGHRGRGVGQDQIPYSMFTWVSGARSTAAILGAIDPPASADRNWTVRPGTESDEWLLAHGIPVLTEADGVRTMLTPTRGASET